MSSYATCSHLLWDISFKHFIYLLCAHLLFKMMMTWRWKWCGPCLQGVEYNEELCKLTKDADKVMAEEGVVNLLGWRCRRRKEFMERVGIYQANEKVSSPGRRSYMYKISFKEADSLSGLIYKKAGVGLWKSQETGSNLQKSWISIFLAILWNIIKHFPGNSTSDCYFSLFC